MKIVSWNINGIRAWHKKNAHQWFIKINPDIFCVQETKADVSQIPAELKNLTNYLFFSDSSRIRKGYSGVALWTKTFPNKVQYGLGIPEFDNEGRLIVAYFEHFAVMNCYFPNGGQGPHRIEFKLKYYEKFLEMAKNIEKSGLPVIFCGDINTAHHEIDLARPKENVNNTGFLPIERAWLDKVEQYGFVDTYRFKHLKDVKYTYWDMKTFARDRNVGWRIDYFFVSEGLKNKVHKAEIYDDVLGSDHCPIELDIEI